MISHKLLWVFGANVHQMFQQQLQFVCGKGGVGKSTVSLSLANYFAHQRLRTLLVEVNSLSGTPNVIRELQKNLWTVNLSPDACAREYLVLKLHSERLYKLVFDNPVADACIRFIPGLDQLTMMGKIWFHSTEKRVNGKPQYDRIVIDCPATGHGLAFLEVAQIFYDAAKHGPIAHDAQLMAQTIADPEKSRVHIVTLLEELPVHETSEFIKCLCLSQAAMPGAVVINRLGTRIFNETLAVELSNTMIDTPSVDPDLAAALEIAQDQLFFEKQQTEQLQILRLAADELPLFKFLHERKADEYPFAALN